MVIFSKASLDDCDAINQVLDTYQAIMDQKETNSKSILVLPMFFHPRLKCLIGRNVNIGASEISFTYLGVTMSANRILREDVNEIIDRMQRKPSGWRKANWSQACKITLVQSVLNSISNYRLITTWVQDGTLDHNAKIIWNFIWSKGKNC